jgi:serine/threonine protein kinase
MPRPDDARKPSYTTREETGEILPVGGGYRLLHLLGQGAFGEVWRAEAPGGVAVAVKLISRTVKPEEARRELEALEVIKRLRHQNLLALQAFFSLPDQLIIILELADTSLRARLRQCEKTGQGLPPADLLRYTLEAAEALDYLHEQKVQHRDIKPDNLLLLGNHVKVADFGLARVLETVMLQSASQAGTPAYMPPEIWRKQLSPHSDQYSLALTYAELRLARFPLAYDNFVNLGLAHLQGQAELDPLPNAEQAVLRRALAKEPGERYPSCKAFAQALIKAWRVAQRTPGSSSVDVELVQVVPRPQVSAELPTKPPSSHRTELPPKSSPPRKKDAWKQPPSIGPRPAAKSRGAEFQQLRQAVILNQLRQVLGLHNKPTVLTWIEAAVLGIPLALFGGGIAAELLHFLQTPALVFGAATIAVLLMAIPFWVLLRKLPQLRVHSRERLIANIMAESSQEVQSWGGENVLRDAVALRELIRILEEK